MPLNLLLLAFGMVAIAAWLRYTKGVAPLRRAHRRPSETFPAPVGLVRRLDGIDEPNRKVGAALSPRVTAECGVAFPRKWDSDVTLATVATVAHTWALAKLAEDDPEGHREREQALTRAAMVPFLSFLLLATLVLLGKLAPYPALVIQMLVWAVMTYAAFRTHHREWAAVTVAREALKASGMWPQMPGTATALDRAVQAQAWCRVGGFPRYFPKW